MGSAVTEGSDNERIRQLEHELLIARDELIGLRAQLTQLNARLELLATTPVGHAMDRIDNLENERQTLYDYVTAIRVDSIEQLRVQEEQFRASRTWRAGQLALSPITVARRIVRRR